MARTTRTDKNGDLPYIPHTLADHEGLPEPTPIGSDTKAAAGTSDGQEKKMIYIEDADAALAEVALRAAYSCESLKIEVIQQACGVSYSKGLAIFTALHRAGLVVQNEEGNWVPTPTPEQIKRITLTNDKAVLQAFEERQKQKKTSPLAQYLQQITEGKNRRQKRIAENTRLFAEKYTELSGEPAPQSLPMMNFATYNAESGRLSVPTDGHSAIKCATLLALFQGPCPIPPEAAELALADEDADEARRYMNLLEVLGLIRRLDGAYYPLLHKKVLPIVVFDEREVDEDAREQFKSALRSRASAEKSERRAEEHLKSIEERRRILREVKEQAKTYPTLSDGSLRLKIRIKDAIAAQFGEINWEYSFFSDPIVRHTFFVTELSDRLQSEGWQELRERIYRLSARVVGVYRDGACVRVDALRASSPHTESLSKLLPLHKETKLLPYASDMITVALGDTVTELPLPLSLALMGNALILGDAGTGKSVLMHYLLCQMMQYYTPADVRFAPVTGHDEYAPYRSSPFCYTHTERNLPPRLHRYGAEPTAHLSPRQMRAATENCRLLMSLIDEMLWRLEEMECEGFYSYIEWASQRTDIPRIVTVIDSLPELALAKANGLDHLLRRLAVDGPKVGMHLFALSTSCTEECNRILPPALMQTRIFLPMKRDTDFLSAIRYLCEEEEDITSAIRRISGRSAILFSPLYTSPMSFVIPEIPTVNVFEAALIHGKRAFAEKKCAPLRITHKADCASLSALLRLAAKRGILHFADASEELGLTDAEVTACANELCAMFSFVDRMANTLLVTAESEDINVRFMPFDPYERISQLYSENHQELYDLIEIRSNHRFIEEQIEEVIAIQGKMEETPEEEIAMKNENEEKNIPCEDFEEDTSAPEEEALPDEDAEADDEGLLVPDWKERLGEIFPSDGTPESEDRLTSLTDKIEAILSAPDEAFAEAEEAGRRGEDSYLSMLYDIEQDLLGEDEEEDGDGAPSLFDTYGDDVEYDCDEDGDGEEDEEDENTPSLEEILDSVMETVGEDYGPFTNDGEEEPLSEEELKACAEDNPPTDTSDCSETEKRLRAETRSFLDIPPAPCTPLWDIAILKDLFPDRKTPLAGEMLTFGEISQTSLPSELSCLDFAAYLNRICERSEQETEETGIWEKFRHLSELMKHVERNNVTVRGFVPSSAPPHKEIRLYITSDEEALALCQTVWEQIVRLNRDSFYIEDVRNGMNIADCMKAISYMQNAGLLLHTPNASLKQQHEQFCFTASVPTDYRKDVVFVDSERDALSCGAVYLPHHTDRSLMAELPRLVKKNWLSVKAVSEGLNMPIEEADELLHVLFTLGILSAPIYDEATKAKKYYLLYRTSFFEEMIFLNGKWLLRNELHLRLPLQMTGDELLFCRHLVQSLTVIKYISPVHIKYLPITDEQRQRVVDTLTDKGIIKQAEGTDNLYTLNIPVALARYIDFRQELPQPSEKQYPCPPRISSAFRERLFQSRLSSLLKVIDEEGELLTRERLIDGVCNTASGLADFIDQLNERGFTVTEEAGGESYRFAAQPVTMPTGEPDLTQEIPVPCTLNQARELNDALQDALKEEEGFSINTLREEYNTSISTSTYLIEILTQKNLLSTPDLHGIHRFALPAEKLAHLRFYPAPHTLYDFDCSKPFPYPMIQPDVKVLQQILIDASTVQRSISSESFVPYCPDITSAEDILSGKAQIETEGYCREHYGLSEQELAEVFRYLANMGLLSYQCPDVYNCNVSIEQARKITFTCTAEREKPQPVIVQGEPELLEDMTNILHLVAAREGKTASLVHIQGELKLGYQRAKAALSALCEKGYLKYSLSADAYKIARPDMPNHRIQFCSV